MNRYTSTARLHGGYVDAPIGYRRTGEYTFEPLCAPDEGTWQLRRTMGSSAYAPLEYGCFKVACGDGRVEEGEACDDGDTTNEGWCSFDCQFEIAFCGDGHVSPSEVCDEGEANRDTYSVNQTCHSSCQGYAPHCGDGVVQQSQGEMCDPGAASSDSCSADCTL